MSNVINTKEIEKNINKFLESQNVDEITQRWFNSTFRKFIIKNSPNRKIQNSYEYIEWDKEFIKKVYKLFLKNKSSRISVNDLLQKEKLVKNINTHLYWKELKTKNEFSKYGYQLRSCLKNYYPENKTKRLIDIYVLIDYEVAVAVIGVINNSIQQIKGYKNQIIEKQYWNIVYDFIKQWDIKTIDLQNIGRLENGEYIKDIKELNIKYNITINQDIKFNNINIYGDANFNNSIIDINEGIIHGKLYCRNSLLKTHMMVEDDIHANGLKNKVLNKSILNCKKSLYIQNSLIENLDYSKIQGDLDISNTNINKINIIVEGSFYARNTNLYNIPEFIGKSIIIPNTQVKYINKDFINGDLDISNTTIKELKNIEIKGNLYLFNTTITYIEESVKVHGIIFTNSNINFENKENRLIFYGEDYDY